MALVVDSIGGLELHLDVADVSLRKPVPLVVGALRQGPAVVRAGFLLSFVARPPLALLGLRELVERDEGDPEALGDI